MLNKATLIGNVGKQPIIRTTKEGKEIATFSLATSETWKDENGGKQIRTTWHNICVFTPGLVKVVKDYIKGGMKIYLAGRLVNSSWLDATGHRRDMQEIHLRDFSHELIMLDRKNRFEEEAPTENTDGFEQVHISEEDLEKKGLPF